MCFPAYEHLMPFVVGDAAMNTYVRLIDDGCGQIEAMELVRKKNQALSEYATNWQGWLQDTQTGLSQGMRDARYYWHALYHNHTREIKSLRPEMRRPALQTPGGVRARWYQLRRRGAISVMFYRTQTPHLLDEPCNTCATLRLRCRENRIKGRSKMRRKQMIQALMSL